MVTVYRDFKVKPFEQLSIVQTKKDKQLVKYHTDLNNNLVCTACGKGIINFEVIIKTTATVTANGEVTKLEDGNIMLIKPIKCSHCGGLTFTETFAVNEKLFAANEDLYGQQIN